MNKLLFSIVVAIILVGCDKPAINNKEEEILAKMIHEVASELSALGFKVDLRDIKIRVENAADMALIFNHLSERSKTSMTPGPKDEVDDGINSRLAFYDPNSKSIILRQGVANTISKGYLAHELAHVYQDQTWGFADIWDPYREDPSRERFNITQFMIEGYAEMVRQAYEQDQEKGSFFATNLSTTLGKMVENDCLVCGTDASDNDLPYSMGLRFLAYQYRQGGWPLVDGLMGEHPSSSEQLLHPNKYNLDRASAFSMPIWQELGYELSSSEELGEVGLLSKLIELSVPGELALKAASGWDGDVAQTYKNGDGQEVLVWRMIFDRVVDAQQLESTLKTHTKMGDIFRVGRMLDWIISNDISHKKQARIFFSKNLLNIKANVDDEKSTLEQEIALDNEMDTFSNPYLAPKILVGPKE